MEIETSQSSAHDEKRIKRIKIATTKPPMSILKNNRKSYPKFTWGFGEELIAKFGDLVNVKLSKQLPKRVQQMLERISLIYGDFHYKLSQSAANQTNTNRYIHETAELYIEELKNCIEELPIGEDDIFLVLSLFKNFYLQKEHSKSQNLIEWLSLQIEDPYDVDSIDRIISQDPVHECNDYWDLLFQYLIKGYIEDVCKLLDFYKELNEQDSAGLGVYPIDDLKNLIRSKQFYYKADNGGQRMYKKPFRNNFETFKEQVQIYKSKVLKLNPCKKFVKFLDILSGDEAALEEISGKDFKKRLCLYYMFENPLPNSSNFENFFQRLKESRYEFGLTDMLCQRVISNKLALSPIIMLKNTVKYPYLLFHLVDLLTVAGKLPRENSGDLDFKSFSDVAFIQLLNYLMEKDLPFSYGKSYIKQYLLTFENELELPIDQSLQELIEDFVIKSIRIFAADFGANIEFLQARGLRKAAEQLLNIRAQEELSNKNFYGYFEQITKTDWVEQPLSVNSLLNSLVVKIYHEDWDLSFASTFLRDNKEISNCKYLKLVVMLLNDLNHFTYLATGNLADWNQEKEQATLELLRRLILRNEFNSYSKELLPLILTHTINLLKYNKLKPTEADVFELLDRLEITTREIKTLTKKILADNESKIDKNNCSKNIQILLNFEENSGILSGLLLNVLGNCH